MGCLRAGPVPCGVPQNSSSAPWDVPEQCQCSMGCLEQFQCSVTVPGPSRTLGRGASAWWDVPQQDSMVLPLLARDCHPHHGDQQHLLGTPHLSPTPGGAWGTQTGCTRRGVQDHLGLGGSLRGSRSRARSCPGPSCPQGVTSPVSLGHQPSHLLCQALLCQRPLAPVRAYLPGSSQDPASLRIMGPRPPRQRPHRPVSPLFNIPFKPVNITIYLSFIY